MTLYNKIKKRYNNYTNKHIKQHRKINNTIVKTKITIIFLLRCRRAEITPNFITNFSTNIHNIFKIQGKIPYNTQQTLLKILDYFNIKIHNLLIKHKNNYLRGNETQHNTNKNIIYKLLDHEDSTVFFESENNITKNLEIKQKEKHTKKYDKLIERQRKDLDVHNKYNWFVNKTSIEIPIETQWLYSLGPKFALTITKKEFPRFKNIMDGESCLQRNYNRQVIVQ